MESVEELCDSIALINRSKKILDGTVSSIKDKYRNNTYWVEYTGEYNTAQPSAIFDVVHESVTEGKTTLKVQLKEGQSANQLLSVLLPVVNIQRLDEVIPTMNDIFIDQVKTKN
jgi:ABC-2 type transport system ATP-binding protein